MPNSCNVSTQILNSSGKCETCNGPEFRPNNNNSKCEEYSSFLNLMARNVDHNSQYFRSSKDKNESLKLPEVTYNPAYVIAFSTLVIVVLSVLTIKFICKSLKLKRAPNKEVEKPNLSLVNLNVSEQVSKVDVEKNEDN